jgi:anti-anti-sigma factor
MDPLCDLTIEDEDGTLVVRLAGAIDLSNSAVVGQSIRSRVDNHALGVVLDLSGLRYLDSSALEVLFDLRRRLEHRRQELRLVVPSDSPVRRVLELVALTPAEAPSHSEPA